MKIMRSYYQVSDWEVNKNALQKAKILPISRPEVLPILLYHKGKPEIPIIAKTTINNEKPNPSNQKSNRKEVILQLKYSFVCFSFSLWRTSVPKSFLIVLKMLIFWFFRFIGCLWIQLFTSQRALSSLRTWPQCARRGLSFKNLQCMGRDTHRKFCLLWTTFSTWQIIDESWMTIMDENLWSVTLPWIIDVFPWISM